MTDKPMTDNPTYPEKLELLLEQPNTTEERTYSAQTVIDAHRLGQAEGRRRGLEEAAKGADGWTKSSCTVHSDNPCCHVRTGYSIAEAIRALLESQNASPGAEVEK